MAQNSLVDRMHLAMVESGRPWSAAELAESFLKMRALGAVPEAILRGMLGRDPRFREQAAGLWSALALRSPSIDQAEHVLVWIESGEAKSPEQWRAYLSPLDGPTVGPLAGDDPAEWRRAQRAWSDRRLVTLQPGQLGRFIQWQARRWALPEWGEPLDLLALGRLALVEDGVAPAEAHRLAAPAGWIRRWNLGVSREEPAGVPLPALQLVWDFLQERYGGLTEEELQSRIDAALGVRAVSFEQFRFKPQDLEAIPESSGVYRFLDGDGEILYIGKALRLRRRVLSYFRPLPAEKGKRDQLLARIRHLEFDPLPSELEALVLESRGIRAHRPPWNVQIDVHEPEQLPPDWWWPLFYLAPGEDPARVTAVFLYGAEEGWLLHLPREEQAAPIAPLVRWLESEFFAAASPRGGAGVPMGATPVPEDQSRVTGPPGVRESAGEESMHPAPPPDAIRLDIPEARLALRFFRREEEQCIRLEPIRYRDIEELTRAALRAAREG